MCVMFIFGLILATCSAIGIIVMVADTIGLSETLLGDNKSKPINKVEYIPVRYGDEVFYQKYVGGVPAPRVVTRKR